MPGALGILAVGQWYIGSFYYHTWQYHFGQDKHKYSPEISVCWLDIHCCYYDSRFDLKFSDFKLLDDFMSVYSLVIKEIYSLKEPIWSQNFYRKKIAFKKYFCALFLVL